MTIAAGVRLKRRKGGLRKIFRKVRQMGELGAAESAAIKGFQREKVYDFRDFRDVTGNFRSASMSFRGASKGSSEGFRWFPGTALKLPESL